MVAHWSKSIPRKPAILRVGWLPWTFAENEETIRQGAGQPDEEGDGGSRKSRLKEAERVQHTFGQRKSSWR